MYFLSFLLFSLLFVSTASSPPPCPTYQSPFPPSLPPPLSVLLTFLFADFPFVRTYETPIAIRATNIADSTAWNCVAMFSAFYLDAFTLQRPVVSDAIPTKNATETSKAQAMCLAMALPMVHRVLLPAYTGTSQAIAGSFGVSENDTVVDQDVTDCDGDADCLLAVATEKCFSMHVIASIVADGTLRVMTSDGWNADGRVSGENGEQCTANCEPFFDWTRFTEGRKKGKGKEKSGKQKNRKSKSEESDDESDSDDNNNNSNNSNNSNNGNNRNSLRPWDPLLESNGRGYFVRQTHVVPFIGKYGRTRATSMGEIQRRSSPNPHYDYEYEPKSDALYTACTNKQKKRKINSHTKQCAWWSE